MLRHFVGSAKAAGRIAYCSGGPAGGGVSSSTQTKIKRWPQGHLFLQRWGSGSPRALCALAMTGFFHELRCNSRRQGVVIPPYGGKEYSRAGRCRHRPLRNDDKKCCASRQTQSVSPVPPGQHKRRARRGWRRRDYAKARCKFCTSRSAR